MAQLHYFSVAHVFSGADEAKKMPNLLVQHFSSLPISQYAIAKAQAYARLTGEAFGSHVEIYGFLLAKRTKGGLERLVSDAYLVPGQTVSSGGVDVDPESLMQAGKDVAQLGMGVVGWWHSHGSMQTFASGTDKKNDYTVLDQISASTRVMIPRPRPVPVRVAYDGEEDMESRPTPYPYVAFRGVDPSLVERLAGYEAVLHQVLPVSFSYSLVVNARGDTPYTSISLREWGEALDSPVTGTYKVPIGICSDDTAINEDRLVKELKERVSAQQWVPSLSGAENYPVTHLEPQGTRPKGIVGHSRTPKLGRRERAVWAVIRFLNRVDQLLDR